MSKSVGVSRHFIFTILSILALASGCTFKTPSAESPAINSLSEMVPKAFFFKKGTWTPQSQTEQTFIGSWASIDERGYSQYFLDHGVPQAGHLNLVWRVTEDAVLGYAINPSFDNPEKGGVMIEIPIKRHYHYENDKDGYSRKINKDIKNESQDAFNHRPLMDLDLKNIKVNSWAFSVFWKGPEILDVTDIEWDYERQFLGFTVEAKDKIADTVFNRQAQAKFRFNFLAYNTDPTFRATPFSEATSRFVNVLHILGRIKNGSEPVMMAGHWKLPVTFYPYGVPPEYMDIVESAVAEWNAAFVRAGVITAEQAAAGQGINLSKTQLKYPLDLRYPVINWVQDRRISMYAPLGIGQTIADVTNGQFLYGSVSVWGGVMDEYLNRFWAAGGNSSADRFAALADREKKFSLRNMFSGSHQMPLTGARFTDNMTMAEYVHSSHAAQRLTSTLDVAMEERIKRLAEARRWNSEKPGGTEADSKAYREAVEDLESLRLQKEEIRDRYFQYLDQDLLANYFPGMYRELAPPDQFAIFNQNYPELMADPNRSVMICNEAGGNARSMESGATAINYETLACRVEDAISITQVESEIRQRFSGNGLADHDVTLADFDLQMASVDPKNVADEREMVRAVLKHLVLHEMGHVLGLGHNFKGNILPQQGTIQESIYQDLKKTWLEKKDLNTTVMDYGNPVSNVKMTWQEVKPGPADDQMLAFLYGRRYPAIGRDASDKNWDATNVKWFEVKADAGEIPDETVDEDGSVYKTAFLPACNDFEASTNVDPFCARWDRGATAEEIVRGRFEDFNARLYSLLNAFSGSKGGNGRGMERYLWYTSLQNFSQIRPFYDLMRAQLDSPHFPYRDAFAKIRGNTEALYKFSTSCLDPSKAPAGMEQTFAELVLRNPEKWKDISAGNPIESWDRDNFTPIYDLCRANELALASWGMLLSRKGSDYTTYDTFRRYVPAGIDGGEVDLSWDFIWGSFREIGSFPLRLSALYTITTPMPFFLWGGMVPVPTFSSPEQRYSYAALYPREFGAVIGAAVKENMNLGGGLLREPSEMGSSLMYLDYFMQMNYRLSKDNFNRFPDKYVDNLRSLTGFEIRLSPIIMTNVKNPDDSPFKVYGYRSTYLDFSARKEIPVPYSYLLEDRRVIAKGIDKQMFLPISKFRYLDDDWGYVWALDVRYHNNGIDDGLKGKNAKVTLDDAYHEQLSNCVSGVTGAGLSSFFTLANAKKGFTGFEVQPGVAVNEGVQTKFEISLRDAFKTYHNTKVGDYYPDPAACDNSLRGIGLIVSGAALINGFWLPSTSSYVNF